MLINDRQRIVLQSHLRRADRVKDRRSDIAGGLGEISVAVTNRRPWNIFLWTKTTEHLLFHQTASDADRIGCDAPIFIGRKIVRCDNRFRQRVSRAKADGAAGRRPEIAGRKSDRWEAMQRIPKPIKREWLDVKLDVWAVEVRR